ncbi:MFS transporter [Salipiger mucosus]|uniref:Major facilitator superfamily MFS_1 n=1 Tax=Salipiger mucosus DSM 16094 TaxID=1123237 RepID=S9Q8C6_9RHOB|nr:MFS transporter [Salipiger mucosus]EPX76277.1 major facilitator superfamily MFS_1 [Salipiger mucosus DSM 16094]
MDLLRDLRLSRAPASAFAAMGLFWGGFAALVPDLKPQAGLSDAGFGLAMLLSTFGALAAMWLAPALDARVGRRLLPVLTALMAGAFLLPGMATAPLAFALAMTCAAATCGLLDVVMNARVAALEAAHRRPLMNLDHGMYSLVYAGAALATGAAREMGASPSTVFAALAVAALGCIAIMLTAPPGQGEARGAEATGAAPGWAMVIPAGLVVLIGFMAEVGTEGWSALYLEREIGAGAAAGAVGPALLGLTMFVGRISGQSLSRRLSEVAVLRTGAAVAAAGAILAASAQSVAPAYAGFAVLGAGVSVIVPTGIAWLSARVPEARRAQAISRVSLVGYIGFFAGPPMMGGLSELLGLGAAFAAVGVMLLLVPVLLVPMLARHRLAV